jgi:hypothetical protein
VSAVASSGDPGVVHFQTTYHRARVQGGDVREPLCHVPAVGFSGSSVIGWPMSLDPADVGCARCQRELANGGLAGRRARRLAIALRTPR